MRGKAWTALMLAGLLAFTGCTKQVVVSSSTVSAAESAPMPAMSAVPGSESALATTPPAVPQVTPRGSFLPPGQTAFGRPGSLPTPEIVGKKVFGTGSDDAGNRVYDLGEEGEKFILDKSVAGNHMIEGAFICDELQAVVWLDKDNLHRKAAISTNGGNNWHTVTVGEGNCEGMDITFSSPQHGFVLVCEDRQAYLQYRETFQHWYTLYATADGGKSWRQVSSFGTYNRIYDIQFADDKIGWMTVFLTDEDKKALKLGAGEAVLYETNDGGTNWQQADMVFSGGVNGDWMTAYHYIPRWENGQWECTVQAAKWGTTHMYTSWPGDYTYTYHAGRSAWVWDEPGWVLPPEVDKASFYQYILNFEYPYEYKQTGEGDDLHRTAEMYDYNAQSPTEKSLEFVMHRQWDCYASMHMQLCGAWTKEMEDNYNPNDEEQIRKGLPELALPPNIDAELINARYGLPNRNINANDLEEFYKAAGHFSLLHPGHGFTFIPMEIVDVWTQNDGSIGVLIDFYEPMTTDGGPQESIFLQRRQHTFRPAIVDGVMYFTLLSSTAA